MSTSVNQLFNEALAIGDDDFIYIEVFDQPSPGLYEGWKIKGKTLKELIGNWVKVDIPSAQVLTMGEGDTPVQLVAAPGAGKVIVPNLVIPAATFNSVAYATNIDIAVYIDNSALLLFEMINGLAFTNNLSARMPAKSNVNNREFIGNQPLMARINGGNPTAGDSDLSFYVNYSILTL